MPRSCPFWTFQPSGSFVSARNDLKRRRPDSWVRLRCPYRFEISSPTLWLSRNAPSPNFRRTQRCLLARHDRAVLHHGGRRPALSRLCTAGTEVSAHYVVLEDSALFSACRTEARMAFRQFALVEMPTSIHDRSASRSSIAATISAIRFSASADRRSHHACKGIILRREIPAHRIVARCRAGRKKDPGESSRGGCLPIPVSDTAEPTPSRAAKPKCWVPHGDEVMALQQAPDAMAITCR